MQQRRPAWIVIDERTDVPAATAARRLDSDHISARIGQQLPCHLAQVPNLQHPQTLKRPWQLFPGVGVRVDHQIASSATIDVNSSSL